jgi:acyl-CoA thioester hydrolase
MVGADGGRPRPLGREAFARFVPVSTRWSDNDPYGHVNNAAYYSFFDAAVNAILIEAGLLDPAKSEIIGLVVENNCVFFTSLAFPDAIDVGVGVEALGRSSVRYLVAAFKSGASRAAAQGRYTHVYVDRVSQRPHPIPEGHRRLMESLRAPRP